MKTYKKLFISCLVAVAFLVFVSSAHAATLSQTSVSLSQGQSSVVYASNISTSLYVSSNLNQNVATVSVSGNTISIYANSAGSTTATICENGINVCNTIYIMVYGNSGYNSTGTLGLNISSLTLSAGNSATISSSNSMGLSVSSNSNPNIASISSSSLIPGCYSNSQYSVITGQPCFNNSINNGSVSYVPGCYSNSQYSVITGQSCFNNSINNGSVSYVPGCYSNSQYSVITGQLCFNNYSTINSGYSSGSVVISALSAGSSTITLCQNGNTCSTIYVTVTGYTVPINNPAYYLSTSTSTSEVPIVYSASTGY